MLVTDQFNLLCEEKGTTLIYKRDEGTTLCPCATPEGFRDPFFHFNNPTAPPCDENGMVPAAGDLIEIKFKGFLQAVQSTRATRLSTEFRISEFGTFEEDDHIVMTPIVWNGVFLDVANWGRSGEDIIYEPLRDDYYNVVNVNPHYDATEPDILHHWELGLRRVRPPIFKPAEAT